MPFAAVFVAMAAAAADLPRGAAVRAVGRVAVRGRDRGEIVLELVPPSKIRVEVHEPRGGFVAGFDGEQAWAAGGAGGVRTLPVPTSAAREIIALLGAGDESTRSSQAVEPTFRRWRGHLPEGRRERNVEIAFDGRLDGAGVDFPACIAISEPGAAPEIVIDLTRVDPEPAFDPGWFSPPGS